MLVTVKLFNFELHSFCSQERDLQAVLDAAKKIGQRAQNPKMDNSKSCCCLPLAASANSYLPPFLNVSYHPSCEMAQDTEALVEA